MEQTNEIKRRISELRSRRIKLMNENEELLKDMLDFAIQELQDNEIELINQMKVCDDYQSIFECLKQRALKRQGKR